MRVYVIYANDKPFEVYLDTDVGQHRFYELVMKFNNVINFTAEGRDLK